jgi:hypothetical protein
MLVLGCSPKPLVGCVLQKAQPIDKCTRFYFSRDAFCSGRAVHGESVGSRNL